MLTLPIFRYALNEHDLLPPDIATFQLPVKPHKDQLGVILTCRDKILKTLRYLDETTAEHCKEDDAAIAELVKRLRSNRNKDTQSIGKPMT